MKKVENLEKKNVSLVTNCDKSLSIDSKLGYFDFSSSSELFLFSLFSNIFIQFNNVFT